MNEEPVLAVAPRVYRYAAYGDLPGESRLQERLSSQKDTQPVPISKPADILLDAEGLVQGDYRLTLTALTQLCSILVPGLSNVVQSLSGLRKRVKDYPQESYSAKRAIGLLNDMIKLRSNLLIGRYRFILDRRNRQIEGVVGPKYRFLSNSDMYRRVQVFMRNAESPASFYEAAIAGRRLQLRYKNDEQAFALSTPVSKMEPFFGGWHFSNSELGDCCVKGSSVLFRRWSNTVAMRPYDRSSKLAHIQGSQFEQKFAKVLSRIQIHVAGIAEYKTAIMQLQGTSLGLGGHKQDHDKRCSEIEKALLKGGVGQRLAEDVLARAVVYGSYRAGAIEMGREANALQAWNPAVIASIESRTNYDVYNALGYFARRYKPERQEAIEEIAFKLLTGQITLD